MSELSFVYGVRLPKSMVRLLLSSDGEDEGEDDAAFAWVSDQVRDTYLWAAPMYNASGAIEPCYVVGVQLSCTAKGAGGDAVQSVPVVGDRVRAIWTSGTAGTALEKFHPTMLVCVKSL
jgi:hypothetical protein